MKFVWSLTDRALEQEFYAARDGWLARHAPTLLAERSYASTLLIVCGDPQRINSLMTAGV